MQCRERCAPIWIARGAGQQQHLEHIPACAVPSAACCALKLTCQQGNTKTPSLRSKHPTHLGRLCVVCGLNWPRLRLKLAGVGRLHLQQTKR